MGACGRSQSFRKQLRIVLAMLDKMNKTVIDQDELAELIAERDKLRKVAEAASTYVQTNGVYAISAARDILCQALKDAGI